MDVLFISICVILIISLFLLSPIIDKPARGYIVVDSGKTLTIQGSYYADNLVYSNTYIAGMITLFVSVILLIGIKLQ